MNRRVVSTPFSSRGRPSARARPAGEALEEYAKRSVAEMSHTRRSLISVNTQGFTSAPQPIMHVAKFPDRMCRS